MKVDDSVRKSMSIVVPSEAMTSVGFSLFGARGEQPEEDKETADLLCQRVTTAAGDLVECAAWSWPNMGIKVTVEMNP